MDPNISDLENMIDDLQAAEQHQANCMFQLSLMVARLALSPLTDEFKDQSAQTMLELVRAKRTSAPVVTHSRFAPEQRKPWLVEAHGASVPQMLPSAPVSMKFGSGALA